MSTQTLMSSIWIACGITSQRNTEFAWDKNSGLPIGNAVTWQDLRTAPMLREIEALPFAAEARYRLGYPPGTYMTAVHLVWRMRYEEELRAAAEAARAMAAPKGGRGPRRR